MLGWLIHAVELLHHQAMHKRTNNKILSLLNMQHLHISVVLKS